MTVNGVLADRLVIAAVRLTRWLRAADPEPALSGPQASALAVVVYAGGISPSDLAKLEQVRRPTIARVIGELEAMQLIERARHPTDGRSVMLKATARGRDLLASGQKRKLGPLIERLGTLSTQERRLLSAALPVLERLIGPESQPAERPL